MKIPWIVSLLLLVAAICGGQEKATPPDQPKSATVPALIDHNRVVIDAELPLPGGQVHRTQVWVDNGDPDLNMSRRMATLLGLNVSCTDTECSAPAPPAIIVGGLTIPLSEVKQAHIPLKSVSAASVMAGGLHAEINLPSTVLRHYDVLVDFPGHKFSIGLPGTIHFHGESQKAQINAESGLIQIPSEIERKKYNLALDLGSCINFLSEDIFNKIASTHPDWPRMTGAVGSANMWGMADEAKWQVMRLDRLHYGPLYLTNVAMVALPKSTIDFFEKRAGMPTAGLLSSQALINFRVGLDYAHSLVYFELAKTFNFPDFDVIGLVLRPEDDGQFTILGVADFENQPSLPAGPNGVQPGDHLVAVNDLPVQGASMGQVWSMLGGTPGQERKLDIERGGRRFAIIAKVRHFLGEVPDEKEGKKK